MLQVNGVVGYITRMAVNSENTVRKLVSLSRAQVQSVQDYRFDERIQTESEAIRRLIDLGLKAAHKGAPTKAKD